MAATVLSLFGRFFMTYAMNTALQFGMEVFPTQLRAQGNALAQLSETVTGTRFAFVDATASLGHMIELYEASEGLTGFYAMVRAAAQNWDGSDVIRELGDLQ